MENNTKNIFQRINAVMAEVDYIQKSEKKVANQYRFVSHDQVTGVLHPKLTKHGIVVVPTVCGVKQDGNRTEITIDVSFINIDKPDDKFSVQYVGYGIDTGDKGPGKAISYAYKYALLKVFCLETGDDPDQDQNVKHEKTFTPEQIEEINEILLSVDPDWWANVQKTLADSGVTHWSKRDPKHFEKFKAACLANVEVVRNGA